MDRSGSARWIFSVSILVIFFASGCKMQSEMPDLHFEVRGSGSPIIVLDVGVGETYSSWDPVIEQLSNITSVFVYDRAGYYQSATGPRPRHSRRVAHELEHCLRQNGIKPPYLLLGHSLGAMNLQVFANDYPQLVSGMILIDPPPLDWLTGTSFPELREMFITQTRQMEQAAEALLDSPDPEDNAQGRFLQILASEHNELMTSSAQQVAEIKSFSDLPVTVLAAGRFNPLFGDEAEAYQKFWNDQCLKVSQKSSIGNYKLVSGATHHIHLDAPEIVIQAVSEMIKTADK